MTPKQTNLQKAVKEVERLKQAYQFSWNKYLSKFDVEQLLSAAKQVEALQKKNLSPSTTNISEAGDSTIVMCKHGIGLGNRCRNCAGGIAITDKGENFAGVLEEELAAKPMTEAAADTAVRRIKVGTFGILERSGKVLLGLRNADDETIPNCWCHPGGGVEYGENVNAALHREFLEEVLMDIEIQRGYCAIHEYFGEGRHVMLIFKHVTSVTQFPKFGEGFRGTGWFTIEQIRDLAKEGHTTPLTIVAAEAWHAWKQGRFIPDKNVVVPKFDVQMRP